MPQPQFNHVGIQEYDRKNLIEYLDRQTKALGAALRGPVMIPKGSVATTATVKLQDADLTTLTITDHTAITLSTETRPGAWADLEVAMDGVGGWIVAFSNATGPNGVVEAPATDANQKSYYVGRYTGDGWLLVLLASNYRGAASDVGVSAAIARLLSAMDPLERTQVFDEDWAIAFDEVA